MEKVFPSLFRPRRFFLGAVQVEAWGYKWGYSKAYIELMTIDATITDFGKNKGKNEIPDADALEEARQAYQKMKAEREKQKAVKVKI